MTTQLSNPALIGCNVSLADGTKTYITGTTNSGYRLHGRRKQLAAKHMRVLAARLVEDASDKPSTIVDGVRVNLTRKQLRLNEQPEAPDFSKIKRQADQPASASSSDTKASNPSVAVLKQRIDKLEAQVERLLKHMGKDASQKQGESTVGTYSLKISVRDVKELAGESLAMSKGSKIDLAERYALSPNAVRRGLLFKRKTSGEFFVYLGYQSSTGHYIVAPTASSALTIGHELSAFHKIYVLGSAEDVAQAQQELDFALALASA